MTPHESSTPTTAYHNVVNDNAYVGMQAGEVHGDVLLYYLSGSETPSQKAKIGEARLDGGMYTQAEPLLSDAVHADYGGVRTAYYWALAVLGGRTRDQLDSNQLVSINQAYGMVAPDAEDSWAQGLRLIHGLVGLSCSDDGKNSRGLMTQKEIIAAYDRLHSDRAKEIRRHLDQILDGVLLDHIHQEDSTEVALERMGTKRADRAWKFFAPVPARPERIPPPPRRRSFGAWLKLATAIAVVGAVGSLIVPTLTNGPALLLVAFPLMASGLAGVLHYGVRRRILLDEDQDEAAKFSPPIVDGKVWKPDGATWVYFLRQVIDGAFREYAPTDREERDLWMRETYGYRVNLTKEIADNYQAPEVSAKPSRLRWLARWHAAKVARMWAESDNDEGNRSPVPTMINLGIGASSIALAVGASLCWWLLWSHGGFLEYTVLPLLLASGIRVACDQGCGLYTSAEGHARAEVESEQRHRDETTAHQAECEVLSDRPGDTEMARWLDYDKRYLRAKAMEQFQIGNSEVVAHVILSEPYEETKKKDRWARVAQGPKRYREYIIKVLLMTKGGVRLAGFHLDTCTGIDVEVERRSFRYDAIASVHVTNDDDKRSQARDQNVAKQQEGDQNGQKPSRGRRRPRNVFQIVLLNQERPIEVFLDVADEELENFHDEDSHELIEHALDSSGVSGALRTMEAISADGKEWLDTQANRTRRRRQLPPDRPGSN